MNRRSFLRLLQAGALGGVAHALDLDRLLWVPGQKTFFLPAPPALDDWANVSGVMLIEDITLLEYQRRYNAAISQCAEVVASHIDADLRALVLARRHPVFDDVVLVEAQRSPLPLSVRRAEIWRP